MLILGRSAGQSIIIGKGEEEIVVRVMSVDRDNGIKIGIKAPSDIRILREEIVKKYQDYKE